jgi:hypothetical protein
MYVGSGVSSASGLLVGLEVGRLRGLFVVGTPASTVGVYVGKTNEQAWYMNVLDQIRREYVHIKVVEYLL